LTLEYVQGPFRVVVVRVVLGAGLIGAPLRRKVKAFTMRANLFSIISHLPMCA
jgi:hypothetical protein